jgi:DNA-binding PadR family transcriptional regulator
MREISGEATQMGQMPRLGEFEELVLLAVSHLRGDAYGLKIKHAIEDVAGRPASIGAVYTALERLEEKGFVTSWEGQPTPERGGRAKRFYRVEGAGVRALEDAELARVRLRAAPHPATATQGGAPCAGN